MPRRTTKGKTGEQTEYRLLLLPTLAERTQTIVTHLVLETTKAFASYRYELSVEERLEGRSLHLSVLGFRTPKLSLPGSGPARFEREYPHWRGTYQISITGIDGRTNEFSVRVGPKHIEVLKAPRQPFVQFFTETSSWSETQP
jgi:hypothetical protein